MTLGTKNCFVELTARNPKYGFELINVYTEWLLGGIELNLTFCNLCAFFRWNYKPEILERMETKGRKEFADGDYYFFVHNKNPLLKEFAEYMEEHPELRFWQALTAWTGKDITVGSTDPFYWTNKLQ